VRYIEEDDEFTGDIAVPSLNDIVIEKPNKLTIASLRNAGTPINMAPLIDKSDGIEVTSKTYFDKDLG
jgi:hypothetical protein